MPRFAANVSTLYPEHPLLDRIDAAARDGFAAVEVQSPYAASASEMRRALADARTQLVLMNAPQGDMDAGAWSCGMVAGLIHDVPTCKELIDRIMREAHEIITSRLAGMAAA